MPIQATPGAKVALSVIGSGGRSYRVGDLAGPVLVEMECAGSGRWSVHVSIPTGPGYSTPMTRCTSENFSRFSARAPQGLTVSVQVTGAVRYAVLVEQDAPGRGA
jgi:hypothetical protein